MDAEWIRQELYEFGDKVQQPAESALQIGLQPGYIRSLPGVHTVAAWDIEGQKARSLLKHRPDLLRLALPAPGYTTHSAQAAEPPKAQREAAVRPDQSRRFCGLPNTQANLTVNVELLEKGYGDGGGGKVNMAPGSGKLDL